MLKTDIPVTQEQSRTTWDRRYMNQPDSLWGAAGQTLTGYLTGMVEVLSVPERGTALEIPCGDGRHTAYLARSVPFLVAIDSSRTALALARKAITVQQITNVLFQQEDIFSTGYVDDSFDGCFCFDLLGHLRNPEDAIAELLRICKPGCRVVGSIFSVSDDWGCS